MKPKVIVIVGPTASGKTALSIELAKKLNGEIISADSMQIYKKMSIGTAKPTLEEMQGITHHMIDIIEPNEDYNVAMYKKMAEDKIEEILSKGKQPIIAGGTGLYVDTLVNGIEFFDIENDFEYRTFLEKETEKNGVDWLFEKLQNVDPEAAKSIEKNNVRRVIRALEIYKVTGKTKTQLDIESRKGSKYDYIILGMLWNREELYERINLRVDIMLKNGLVEEVKSLLENDGFSKTALQGLGYKEVVQYLENKIPYEEMIEKIKMETRRYAKRQMTWFNRNKNIIWLDAKNKNLVDEALNNIN
ncbi:MAG: tRNA (adenosine(37)-N6)-dimethylallyltransferase MiaA [Clostridia bacterium]|nr:tRNA (adenosine(37)-N6)-dimethylallyltransferase MiaA [Clostridia bacterium]